MNFIVTLIKIFFFSIIMKWFESSQRKVVLQQLWFPEGLPERNLHFKRQLSDKADITIM